MCLCVNVNVEKCHQHNEYSTQYKHLPQCHYHEREMIFFCITGAEWKCIQAHKRMNKHEIYCQVTEILIHQFICSFDMEPNITCYGYLPIYVYVYVFLVYLLASLWCSIFASVSFCIRVFFFFFLVSYARDCSASRVSLFVSFWYRAALFAFCI